MTGNDFVVAPRSRGIDSVDSLGGELAVCEGDHCITCGDVAVPMTVVRIDERRELALCENEQGARETVEIALVAPVTIGDHLLVHAGTAIAHAEVVA